MTDEIINGVNSTNEIRKQKYSHYLCFTISVRTNKFVLTSVKEYTPKQKEILLLVNALLQTGLDNKSISNHLNENNYLTKNGHKFNPKNVHSLIRRYKEREERIKFMEKEYEPEWSKMKIT